LIEPILAGAALWAKTLLDRITSQMNTLESAKGFLVPVDLVADVNQKFSLQATTLEEYINKVSYIYFIFILIKLRSNLLFEDLQ
jgi:hypothetical protein